MMDFDTRFFFYFGSLLMIWLMADNTVASVNLFQQNDPHQLVWKGHLGKA